MVSTDKHHIDETKGDGGKKEDTPKTGVLVTVNNALVYPGSEGTIVNTANVRVVGITSTGHVRDSTCEGKGDAPTVGGLDSPLLSVPSGPYVSYVSDENVRLLPNYSIGTMSGEGLGTSATESHEYVAE